MTDLGEYLTHVPARRAAHAAVPPNLCRVACRPCGTVWWSPSPIASWLSHWTLEHADADRAMAGYAHPCGVQCDDCADIWLLRLSGLTHDQVDRRMGWERGTARQHAALHRPTDLGTPDPARRKSGATYRREARARGAAA